MLTRRNGEPVTAKWVFTGPDGIRAGWSVLIFAAVFIAISAAVSFALRLILGHHDMPKGDIPINFMLVREGVSAVLIMAATAVMARIEGRSLWDYGMAWKNWGRNCVLGLVCGLAALSTLVGVLYAGGYLVFDGLAIHGAEIAINGLTMLLLFFFVGVTEETLFRGYFLTTLTRGIGFWPAAVVMSLLFGAAHISNQGETAVGILQVFVAGMLLCALLRVTGSLWLSIGFHAAWDWAQSYLYGTADSGMMFQGHFLISHAAGNAQLSGGATGPEGSLLATPILIGGLALMLWGMRGRGPALAAA